MSAAAGNRNRERRRSSWIDYLRPLFPGLEKTGLKKRVREHYRFKRKCSLTFICDPANSDRLSAKAKEQALTALLSRRAAPSGIDLH
jgi:hypothetical protein